jgi:hypothetical protein
MKNAQHAIKDAETAQNISTASEIAQLAMLRTRKITQGVEVLISSAFQCVQLVWEQELIAL